MKRIGARLGRVLDESAARVAVLRRIAGRGDLHLLHGIHRRCALLALLVPARVTERGAIEEILGRGALAAVDAGLELAAAEHRVAVRLHRKVARLHLQHGLGKAHIPGRDNREVAVVFLVDGMADVGLGDTESRLGCDLNRFVERAHLQDHVLPKLIAPFEQDARAHSLLESSQVDGHRISAEDKRRRGVRPGGVRHLDSVDTRGFITNRDRRARNRGTLRIRDDATDNGSISALCQQGSAQADAQAESGN